MILVRISWYCVVYWTNHAERFDWLISKLALVQRAFRTSKWNSSQSETRDFRLANGINFGSVWSARFDWAPSTKICIKSMTICIHISYIYSNNSPKSAVYGLVHCQNKCLERVWQPDKYIFQYSGPTRPFWGQIQYSVVIFWTCLEEFYTKSYMSQWDLLVSMSQNANIHTKTTFYLVFLKTAFWVYPYLQENDGILFFHFCQTGS